MRTYTYTWRYMSAQCPHYVCTTSHEGYLSHEGYVVRTYISRDICPHYILLRFSAQGFGAIQILHGPGSKDFKKGWFRLRLDLIFKKHLRLQGSFKNDSGPGSCCCYGKLQQINALLFLDLELAHESTSKHVFD